MAPRPRPTSRLKRNREETFEPWVERAGCAGCIHGNPKLMNDLILTDDHRIAPDRNGDRVAYSLFPGQHASTLGKCPCKAGRLVCISDIALYPMAGLENEYAAGSLSVKSRSETLALDGWNVTRMGHERDDRRGAHTIHVRRARSVRSAIGRGRPLPPAVWL